MDEQIAASIIYIRGHRVILDSFHLTKQEVANLRCQFGTSSSWGGTRYAPLAFTEQGVAMLSTVLASKRAIPVNVELMRPDAPDSRRPIGFAPWRDEEA